MEANKLAANMNAKAMVLIRQITKGILTLVILVAIAAQPGCSTKKADESPEALGKRYQQANALYTQGNFREAEAEYRALFKICERVAGPEHPDTLAIRSMRALHSEPLN